MGNDSKAAVNTFPVVLQTGFRIFFLGAAVYTVLSMAFWLLFYVVGINIFVPMPLTIWHGHEMVFGFTLAVVAGFLLTAVINWTGEPTLSGKPLLFLFLLWVAGRILAFVPSPNAFWPMAACDLLFLVYLSVAIIRPIIKVKQWQQSAVFSKLLLLFGANLAFFIALFGKNLLGERKALRFAVYMVVSLIFTVGRRILPFFIQAGVGYPVNLRNHLFLDISSLVLLIAFAITDIFFSQFKIGLIVLSALLVIVHVVRLGGWYTPGIWKKPLLWVLFIGYIFLIVGFVLKVYTVLAKRPDDAALHSFTTGGIGLFTLGMMARISWGHTGRSIGQPPPQISAMFIIMVMAAVARVFLPLLGDSYYVWSIAGSQILWMAAFAMFCWIYFPVLTAPRPDGKWG